MDDLERRFRYHKPVEPVQNRIEGFREDFLRLAESINKWIPEGREKSLAITHLEEALMWTVASLVRQ